MISSTDVYIFPCSFVQRRLWFLEQMDPGTPAYNISGAIRIEGALNAQALQQALDNLVQRHESLRTSFAEVDGEPMQVVSPDAAAVIQSTDLSNLGPAAREEEAKRLLAEESELGFDLRQAPLLRARLIRLSLSEHLLMLSLHHVVADGWSLRILLSELGDFYNAAVNGETADLPALPFQYPDFAVWQQETLTKEALDEQAGYWRERLQGAPPLLELPLDHPRTLRQGWRGASEPISLGPETSANLRALCRAQGVTLFMGLLAGFQALLSRYASVPEVVVGAPVAGRTQPGIEGVIGMFANTVALRTDLSGDPTFRELLTRVRSTCLGAYQHEDYPFERLVELLRESARELSHSPVVQVLFALQEEVLKETVWAGGLRLRREPYVARVAKFDLSLMLGEDQADRSITGWLEYRTELFDAWRIQRMAGHLRNLLSAAVAEPDQHLSRLSLLSDEERQQLVTGWNQNQKQFARDICMHELFAQQVDRTPDAIAAEHHGRQLTYAELDRRSNQ
ncbi:MAG TPA: condensation domain-containing protein, partial [Pyrinomonadaceae bacterium]